MQVEYNKSLKSLNTFGIDVTANAYVKIENSTDIPHIFNSVTKQHNRFLILGGGSNILFTQNFNGVVLHIANKGINIVEEAENELFVEVAAGEVWDDFVVWCSKRNLYGVENLAAIPGCVGAAPVQNIGAYGAEVKDVVTKVNGISLIDGGKMSLLRNHCDFGYRNSIFKKELKGKVAITSVVFRMLKSGKLNTGYSDVQKLCEGKQDDDLTPGDVARMIREIRNKKLPDPAFIGSAGSFFKNPVVKKEIANNIIEKYPKAPSWEQPDGDIKLAAGWMIDTCGLKGHIKGEAAVYDKQALVLVNKGKATGKEVVELARYIIETVQQNFGVTLEPEVNII